MSLQVSKTPPSEQSRLWRTRAFSSESGVTSRSSRCFICVCVGVEGWGWYSLYGVKPQASCSHCSREKGTVWTVLQWWPLASVCGTGPAVPCWWLEGSPRCPHFSAPMSPGQPQSVTLARPASRLHGFDQNRSATQKRKLILQRCPCALFTTQALTYIVNKWQLFKRIQLWVRVPQAEEQIACVMGKWNQLTGPWETWEQAGKIVLNTDRHLEVDTVP